MKRFIISILCVSVFFLGIGGLIDVAKAKFRSDQKALELISRARAAIGGDSAIGGVRSMTITGSTTNFFEKNGIPTTQLGAVEINFELPGQFSKTVKIGDPGSDAATAHIEKKIDVVVVGEDGQDKEVTTAAPNGEKKVFVIRKGEGDVNWTTDENAEVKAEGNRMIFKKEDGTVVELPKDGVHKVIVSESADSGESVWNTEDGKKIVISKADSGFARKRHSGNELLRLTMGLLAEAPEGMDVSYKFVGEGDVDGYPANIVAVESQGTSFKIYLDASSSLPRMITYTGHNAVFFREEDAPEMTKDALVKLKKEMAKPVEHQLRFSDFRSVGGLMLPYRWSESVEGKQTQITDISSYEVNPANIADKFGSQKVFVRKMKPEKN